MKNTMSNLLVFLMLGMTIMSFVNDDKYTSAMQKNVQTVYTAQTVADLQVVVSSFERIAETEKTKWEPYYYASFGYIMMANYEQDGAKKDGYLDHAKGCVEKAKALAQGESEIIALEGFVHMMRITIDPMSRGQQYSPLAYEAFNKALALNAENPRALSLLAQMQFGTAQFFNSSTGEACETVEKSIDKFETYKSVNPLAPQWGKSVAQRLKEKCK